MWPFIRDRIRDTSDAITLIVCPFIQSGAIEVILRELDSVRHLQVVTRWRAVDLLSGVSDIEVYPLLRDRGIPLYLHSAIHLKLFVFENAQALVTSANITQSGLGLSATPNVEIAAQARLEPEDQQQLLVLLSECQRVDDAIYEQARSYIEAYRMPVLPPPSLQLMSATADPPFSVLNLPATGSVMDFVAEYRQVAAHDGLGSAEFEHDRLLFGVLAGVDDTSLRSHLQMRFLKQPFTQAVLTLLKTSGSARFGLVTEWVHSLCTDKPTPYRKDIKRLVSNLYQWLADSSSQVRVSRPGHSQILEWVSVSGP